MEPGNLPQSNALSKIRGTFDTKALSLFFRHDSLHAEGDRKVTRSRRKQQRDAVASPANGDQKRCVNEISADERAKTVKLGMG
jgi:hypothetical protein